MVERRTRREEQLKERETTGFGFVLGLDSRMEPRVPTDLKRDPEHMHRGNRRTKTRIKVLCSEEKKAKS